MIPRKNLLTLTDVQEKVIRDAMRDVENAKVFLNALLAMVQPEGSTGFDAPTMTFYTEPPVKETE